MFSYTKWVNASGPSKILLKLVTLEPVSGKHHSDPWLFQCGFQGGSSSAKAIIEGPPPDTHWRLAQGLGSEESLYDF